MCLSDDPPVVVKVERPEKVDHYFKVGIKSLAAYSEAIFRCAHSQCVVLVFNHADSLSLYVCAVSVWPPDLFIVIRLIIHIRMLFCSLLRYIDPK